MKLPLSILGLALAAQTAAGAPVLKLPIDCELGKSCYVQHYVDRDPGPGTRDFHCGALTYDGHKGTDFGLLSLRDLQRGVNVLAAAPGVVRGVRDGMPDRIYHQSHAAEMDGRDCGNGVVIDHGGGWETQYCHMKKGSILVEQGRRIPAGTVLGQVGLSGRTQFPHLHISVRRQGQVIDPYNPDGGDSCTLETPGKTLWDDPLGYRPGGVIDLGFAAKVPDYDSVKAGNAHEALTRRSPALVAWVYAYGSRKGDRLQISISGPRGEVIQKDLELKKPQALLFRAIGKKRPGTAWPAGSYHAEVILRRDGRVIDQRTGSISLN